MKLDHVTIRTRDLEETKDFFIKVFNLTEKPRPKIIQRIPGYWLYSNDEPIVHIIRSYGRPIDFTTENIDHVGFKLTGYDSFKQKLTDLDIPYNVMDIEEINERRIFFTTPQGILLEGVFHENINT